MLAPCGTGCLLLEQLFPGAACTARACTVQCHVLLRCLNMDAFCILQSSIAKLMHSQTEVGIALMPVSLSPLPPQVV